MELNQWLNNPNRDYNTGVALYLEAKGMDSYYNYFRQVNNAPWGSMHFNMLYKKLERIGRVAAQSGKVIKLPQQVSQQQQQHQNTQRRPQDIKVTQIINKSDSNQGGAPATDAAALRNNRMYVNKILALKWPDLDARDKEVFFNNKTYFENKRELFIANSDNEKKLKSLHANLKTKTEQADRKVILEDARELENKNIKNWEVIDNWTEPPKERVIDPIEKAKREAAEKILKIGLLKGYIRRGENDLKNKKYSDKVKKSKEEKLQGWKNELAKLGNEIA